MRSVLKYIPNGITVSRIFMSLIFICLITRQAIQENGKFIYLFAVFLMICFSDLIDGKIARKTGFASKTGARLDVFADLFYMILSYTALIILKILPLWFLGFIFIKFFEFIITSNFVKRYDKISSHPFVFDRVGRVVAGVFFIMPGVACILDHMMPFQAEDIIRAFLYLTLIAGVYSSYTRIKNCIMIKNLYAVQL